MRNALTHPYNTEQWIPSVDLVTRNSTTKPAARFDLNAARAQIVVAPASCRKLTIQMPDNSAVRQQNRLWWRIFLGLISALALVVLVTTPELAALGFLFDPILLDVAILFFGTQFLLFGSQIRTFLTSAYSAAARGLKSLKPRP